MKKITTVAELMDELTKSGYFGLRGASEHDIEIADRGYLDCSLDLFDRRDCDYDEDADLLSGTSAISVNDFMSEDELTARYNDALGYAQNHHGTNTVYLLSDDCKEYGEDENEVILGHNGYGADIVAIVEL